MTPDISYNPPCSPCGIAWEFLSFSSSFALSTSVHVPRRRRHGLHSPIMYFQKRRTLRLVDLRFIGRPVRMIILLYIFVIRFLLLDKFTSK